MRVDESTPLKFLTEDGAGPYSDYRWPMPRGKRPGKWVRATGNLSVCSNGIHVARGPAAIQWLHARACVMEVRGEHLVYGAKECWREGRIVTVLDGCNQTTQRLFAADCAERSLLRERERGREPNEALWRAVEVARSFARGECDDAARSAARDAAEAAAWAAARDAAEAAAWSAARSAARDAAEAAWSAAWAARDAAWSAAEAAAWAARDAEREWQFERFCAYVNGEVAL